MSVPALLSEMEAAGIELYLEGDRIRFRAPAGALTPARREAIAANRDSLITLLSTRPRVTGAAKGAEHLEPFLDRVRAEAAGRYVEGLAWPEGGALVPDPVAHFERYRDRFPAGIVDELGALAGGWAAGDRPAAEGWPVAPEAYRWEYSRLVAWIKAAPEELSAQVAMWGEGVTDHPHPFAKAVQVESGVGSRARPAPWTGRTGECAAWLAGTGPGDLPLAPWQLRPGVTVQDNGLWLTRMKEAIAEGPNGPRSRTGALQCDLDDLARVKAQG